MTATTDRSILPRAEYPGAIGYGWFTRSPADRSQRIHRSPVFSSLVAAASWDGCNLHSESTPYLCVAILSDENRSEMVWDRYSQEWVANQFPAFPGQAPDARSNGVDRATFDAMRAGE